MKALFFGSPAFAVPSLDALARIGTVVGVVCQPDKPKGRGLRLTPPPVKERAVELGIPVQQPQKLRTGDFGAWVRSQAADVLVVVAYGRILPRDVLDATPHGAVNVHASLLPKYRGAAPISWALYHGEQETGVTLMKLDEGMDTGPTFATARTPVDPDETAGALSDRLSREGARLLEEKLPAYLSGALVLAAQDHHLATLAPPLNKEHGRLDWRRSSHDLHNHVRAMNPWPGAHTRLRGRTIKIHKTRPLNLSHEGPVGKVILADKSQLIVACGGGALELCEVQPEGGKIIRARDWVLGRGAATGDQFDGEP